MPRGRYTMSSQTRGAMEGVAATVLAICVSNDASWDPWKYSQTRLTELRALPVLVRFRPFGASLRMFASVWHRLVLDGCCVFQVWSRSLDITVVNTLLRKWARDHIILECQPAACAQVGGQPQNRAREAG